MNREIKFRGKRVDNGEWVEGSLVIADKQFFIITGTTRFYPEICGRSPLAFMEWYEVDPTTVGQCTGLRDSKRTEEYPEGQEIYEGDILQGRDPYEEIYGYAIVKIGEYTDTNLRDIDLDEDDIFPLYGVYIETKNGTAGMGSDHELIIIGNIFDNPELLK